MLKNLSENELVRTVVCSDNKSDVANRARIANADFAQHRHFYGTRFLDIHPDQSLYEIRQTGSIAPALDHIADEPDRIQSPVLALEKEDICLH